MPDFGYLKDLVVILAVAVTVVTLLHRLRIPSIAGFILAGLLVGPDLFGLVNDPHRVEQLAEIGVALLLFGIGLEISFDKLKRLWRPIAVGGTLQVLLSVAATVGIATLFGLPVNSAIFLGFLLAVSSTAIVLRGLEERGEIDAPHGRLTLGILVFQDLCVIPMMLAIPVLSGDASSGSDVAITLLKALAILAGVVLVAQLVMPRIMTVVASTRQRHLFTLAVVLICLGTAWLITKGGVSLPLGAFLAGMVIAGSEFRHQALADLTSFRDVFSSLFFVSVGMLLSPAAILSGIVPVLLILGAILVGKFIVVSATGITMKLPLRVSVLAGVSLAQVGEFSFVLNNTARGTGLLPQPLDEQVIAAAILSMLVTPFAIAAGPRMAAGAGRFRSLTRLLKVRTADEAIPAVEALRDHVIVGGYGFAGQELAKALRRSCVPYVIVDLNVDNVRTAVANGEPAYFGDITSVEVLQSLGITHARELVIVINDSEAVQRAVVAARKAAPDTHIVARTNYLLNYDRLRGAGATEVVSAELAAATEVAALVLARHGRSEDEIEESCSEIRTRTRE